MRRITFFLCWVQVFMGFFSGGVFPQPPTVGGIRHDGTLGNAPLTLTGPDYEIGPENGRLSGANLFHSFERFGLSLGESATFSGPESVAHIIGRVTGGGRSVINGLLRSSIPEADLYLLNPAGIMFGAGARLEVDGSFHASTADYLRLGETDIFSAMPVENEILSTAPPAAFGFITQTPAGIDVEGRGEISAALLDSESSSGLQVPDGEEISFVAGDIHFANGTRTVIDDTVIPLGTLVVEDLGAIHLVSAASAGEAKYTEAGFDVSDFTALGDITLRDHTALHAGGGVLSVRAGTLTLSESYMNVGEIQLGSTYVGAPDGFIDIEADQVHMEKGARLAAETYGAGGGGDILVQAATSFTLSDSYVLATTYGNEPGAGDAGRVGIITEQLNLTGGAYITSATFGSGGGGDVYIIAEDSIHLSGLDADGYGSIISGGSYSQAETSGAAGDVVIQTGDLTLLDGAWIGSETMGGGEGADVEITASGTISISGVDATGWASNLHTSTLSGGEFAGASGDLWIVTDNLILEDGGNIFASSIGPGNAGNIYVQAGNDVKMIGGNPHGTTGLGYGSGIYSFSRGDTQIAGQAGDITVETKNLVLQDGGMINTTTSGTGSGGSIQVFSETVSIGGDDSGNVHLAPLESQITFQENFPNAEVPKTSGIYAESKDTGEFAGDSGYLQIQARDLSLTRGGILTTSSDGAGEAGVVWLEVDMLDLDGGAVIQSTTNSNDFGTSGAVLIAGEIQLTESGSFRFPRPVSRIRIRNGSGINTSTFGKVDAGFMLINTESLEMDQNAYIASNSFSTGEGGDAGGILVAAGIDFDETGFHLSRPVESVSMSNASIIASYTEGTGESGIIVLAARNLDMEGSALIDSSSWSAADTGGEAGGVMIGKRVEFTFEEPSVVEATDRIRIRDGSGVNSSTAGGGEAGFIVLGVDRLEMDDSAYISSVSFSEGAGGDGGAVMIGSEVYLNTGGEVSITPAGSILMDDESMINTSTLGEGASGAVLISVSDLEIRNDAVIGSASVSSGIGGDGGAVLIGGDITGGWESLAVNSPAESVRISGGSINSSSAGTGDAGYIALAALDVRLTDEAIVASGSVNETSGGDAGNIIICGTVSAETGPPRKQTPGRRLTVDDGSVISTSSLGPGHAGDIDVWTADVHLAGASEITSESRGPDAGGDAGTVRIRADAAMTLEEESTVSTRAATAGGGRIQVAAGESLHMKDAGITTSVHSGRGNGGDINIENPRFFTMNRSRVVADAYAGDGGSIYIVSGEFFQSAESFVSASSQLGIDGLVTVESPETDLTGDLTVLPENFIDAAQWQQTPCGERRQGSVGRFDASELNAVCPSPDAVSESPLLIRKSGVSPPSPGTTP